MGSLREIESEFMRIYEGVATRRGQQAIFGRIMAAFFIEDQGLSQKELSRLTGYSVSSVSRVLDRMVQMGIVNEHKDSSREYSVYHMNTDFIDLALSGLETWVRQSEISRREFDNLRIKIENTTFDKREKVKASSLHLKLKRLVAEIELFLQVMRKNINELRSSPRYSS